MKAIPAAVQTLLKSRAMAGDDQHNHLITLTGAPDNTTIVDPTDWTSWRTYVGDSPVRTYGNMTETSDGRAVIAYIESDKAYIAFADSVLEVVNGTKSFGAGTELKSVTSGQASIALIGGKLHMAIATWPSDGVLLVEHWADSDGEGADMAYVNDIAADICAYAGLTPDNSSNTLGPIIPLSATNWVVICPHFINYYGIKGEDIVPCYSTDSGATWTVGTASGVDIYTYHTRLSVSFLPLSDSTFMLAFESSSTHANVTHYADCGATRVIRAGEWAGWRTTEGGPGRPYGWAAWAVVGDAVYFFTTTDSYNTIIRSYKYKGTAADITYDKARDYAYWDVIDAGLQADSSSAGGAFIATLTTDALVLQHSATYQYSPATRISGVATIVQDSIIIRAKRIDINRNKGMVSSATVVFDNKGGIYSPDKEVGADWKNVMWPNNGIVIQQGYGSELTTTFTGTIDDVKMTSYPAEITLTCRDYLKRAYDQLITTGGVHTVTYTSQTPEAIFTALATLAGWAAGDIHTEATGLTIASKTFTNETYGDAFSWLADMCGYLVYCDEDGDVYFAKDDDDAVPTSDYTYAEGSDIVSIGYTISDRDLYNKIIVIGDGVSYEITYYNTYGILTSKKMIIQASEATTEAQCQAIAEQTRYLMNSRARICEFAAVANPYLQIGDTLTVTETTTLISELYKVTDISTSQSPDGGYIMQITCYHYSAPAES
jgi:hypothetical protein